MAENLLLPNPIEYLKLNSIGKILYYPGAGTDKSPIELFFNNTDVETIIYADYQIGRSDIEGMLMNIEGWFMDEISPIAYNELIPKDFKRDSWEEFWPANIESREFANPDNAFGLSAKLYNADGVYKRFIHLRTEAIQTYSILIENGLNPDIIILQEHGWGGNWSVFGGEDSPLYENAINTLPEYIFVAGNSNTKPWPNYYRVSDYEIYLPSQHERALFRLKVKKS